MNGSLKVVQAIVLLTFVGLCFTSCGGSQTTLGSTGSTSGTTTGGNTGQSSGTEQTIEEEEASATTPSGYSDSQIFVTLPETTDFINYTSVYSDWSQRCTFAVGAPVNELTCVFQTPELGLFNDGVHLQFNVPPNQCKYINTLPYWYYNYEIGYGPKAVSMTVVKDAAGAIVSSTCSVDGGATAPCVGGAPPVEWSDIEFDIAAEASIKCKYDTSTEDGGMNCCLGKYDLYSVVVTPTETTPSIERGKSWGGQVQSCLGGAIKSDWAHFDSEGFPKSFLEKTKGTSKRTKIMRFKGGIDLIESTSNMPVANFFTVGAHDHFGYGIGAASGSVFPAFVDPVSDRSGTEIRSGNPFYTFDCLDEAFETNFRINVMIQEWDTVAALSTYIASGVSGPATADVNGTAPAFCPGLPGERCNQAQDSDDFLLRNSKIPSQTWDNTDPNDRKNYFPKHKYQ